MQNSMALPTPGFSTNRTVREYTEQHYLPAALAYRERAAGDGARGLQLVSWRRGLGQGWATLRFGEMNVVTVNEQHDFRVLVHLDSVQPDAVGVELCADDLEGHGQVRKEMERVRRIADAVGSHVYFARVAATRPTTDYTPRIVAHHVGANVPLEAPFILWQR